ncbi:MAG: hypothetical protein RLZZ368_1759 [Actinomycetota bacterium]|jgi:prolyl-tRNA editing enzyme YbaK/EbsC (Cys-tRNA(Pro) deacylase)
MWRCPISNLSATKFGAKTTTDVFAPVGFSSGGVPPFGHSTQLRVFVDPDFLQWPEVLAAAETWNDVFGIEPHKLVEASGGAVTDMKR